MRTFALSIAAVLLLAAPAAAQAADRGALTTRDARSAARDYETLQVKSLQQFNGLTVTSSHIGRVQRVERQRMTVTVTFGLRWDDGRTFACHNRVYVTRQRAALHAQPGDFDCA